MSEPDMTEPAHRAASVAPKRRFLDRGAATPTLVAQGTHLEGDLHCAGDLSVAGYVLGNAHVQGMLVLSATAQWHGNANCGQALLAGHFNGQLLVNGKLEIRSSARVSGQISAQQVAIAEGAIIEAEIVVLSNAPVHHFAEQRQV